MWFLSDTIALEWLRKLHFILEIFATTSIAIGLFALAVFFFFVPFISLISFLLLFSFFFYRFFLLFPSNSFPFLSFPFLASFTFFPFPFVFINLSGYFSLENWIIKCAQTKLIYQTCKVYFLNFLKGIPTSKQIITNTINKEIAGKVNQITTENL